MDGRCYSALERLPLLPLEMICEYLVRGDSKRRSLFAFSQVSRRCCAAAGRQRFRQIFIDAGGSQEIESISARWIQLLGIDGRAKYVRGIKIIGSALIGIPVLDPRAGKGTNSGENDGVKDVLSQDDPFFKPTYSEKSRGCESKFTGQYRSEFNQAWSPIAALVKMCPGLTDVVWSAADQVPRCVLDVLHEKSHGLLLHVQTFQLRSLVHKVDQLHDIDADEYVLASSPCLASVRVQTNKYVEEGANYNLEAVQHMTSKSAPNLKSVTCCNVHIGGSPSLLAAVRAGRPPWQGFFKDDQSAPQRSVGALDELVFYEGQPDTLTEWASFTDFSHLRSLHLHGIIQIDCLKELTGLAQQSFFLKLKNFSMRLGWDNHEDLEEDKETTRTTTDLLSALPRLKNLHLRNPIFEETFDAVLVRHGPCLTNLDLGNVASIEQLQDIKRLCPLLRYLHIGVKRTGGSQLEVAAYKLLGSLPRLKTLRLGLHYTFGLTEEEESVKEKMEQQMRYEIENAAMDAQLARAISHIIFTANQVATPDGMSTLRRLTLEGVGHHLWDHCFTNITDCLARPWICERQWGIPESDNILIRELGKERLRALKKSLEYDQERKFSACNDGLGARIRPMWEDIWPDSKGKSNWLEIWSSKPLSEP